MKPKHLIGVAIKKLREEQNLKQSVLAKQLDISVQTLSAIENGKVDLHVTQLLKIAEVLKVELKHLVTEGHEENLHKSSEVKITDLQSQSLEHQQEMREL